MTEQYQILEHTADLRIRAQGGTLPELFANMMRGMMRAMRAKSKSKNQKLKIKRKIIISSPDREALLVDFLNEVLYLSEINQEAYKDVKFTKFSDTLRQDSGQAELMAELTGQKRIKIGSQVKAATYHALNIIERDGLFEATIVFDI